MLLQRLLLLSNYLIFSIEFEAYFGMKNEKEKRTISIFGIIDAN